MPRPQPQTKPFSKLKAKCVDNETVLQTLVAIRDNNIGNVNYARTLHRAAKSLASCTTPVTSVSEACALSCIGPHIANLIFKRGPGVAAATRTSSDGSNENNNDSSNRAGQSSNNAAVRKTRKATIEKANAPTSRKRKAVTTSKSNSQDSSRQTTIEGYVGASRTVVPDIPYQESIKERAYQLAVQEAIKAVEIYDELMWTVVLLIDAREKESAHVIAKCQMSGIPCEERHLPVGDMMWIARGKTRTSNGRGQGDGQVKAEVLLGTVVERKTVADLKDSLFGTRYNEQQRRMIDANIAQILMLIEGDIHKDLPNVHPETIHSTLWAMRIHKGLQVIQTKHLDDTVQTLKKMHRRVLQRSFPEAFTDEALPAFGASNGIVQTPSPTSVSRRRRRRRKRVESLLELSFDTSPRPFVLRDRLITYDELKAKVERDREVDARSVGLVHATMLKQVPTLSDKRVLAIYQAYPTISSLCKAYDECLERGEDGSMMLCQLPLINNGSDNVIRRLGPRSSAEVYVAYGMRHGEKLDTNVEDEDPPQLTSGVTNPYRVASRCRVSPAAVSSTSNSSRESGKVANVSNGESIENQDRSMQSDSSTFHDSFRASAAAEDNVRETFDELPPHENNMYGALDGNNYYDDQDYNDFATEPFDNYEGVPVYQESLVTITAEVVNNSKSRIHDKEMAATLTVAYASGVSKTSRRGDSQEHDQLGHGKLHHGQPSSLLQSSIKLSQDSNGSGTRLNVSAWCIESSDDDDDDIDLDSSILCNSPALRKRPLQLQNENSSYSIDSKLTKQLPPFTRKKRVASNSSPDTRAPGTYLRGVQDQEVIEID